MDLASRRAHHNKHNPTREVMLSVAKHLSGVEH